MKLKKFIPIYIILLLYGCQKDNSIELVKNF